MFLQEAGEPKKEPTHFSLLDPKSLKVRSVAARGKRQKLLGSESLG